MSSFENSHNGCGLSSRWADWICLAAAAACGALLAWFQVRALDAYWHLAVGEEMLRAGKILEVNTLSSQFPDYPWTNVEWLFDLLLALLYQSGGWLGVGIGKSCIVALFGALVYRVARQMGADPARALLLTVLALAASRFRFTVRPHILSLVCFAATVWLVAYVRNLKATSLWRSGILWLFGLYLLWGNLHPGFIFGLIYLAVVGGADFAGSYFGTSDRRTAVHLLIAVAGCALAALVNKFGVHVITYPFLAQELNSVIELTEFMTSSPGQFPLLYVMAGGSLLALASGDIRRCWTTFAPVVIFGVLAVMYRRNIPYLAVSAVAAIACAWSGEVVRWRRLPGWAMTSFVGVLALGAVLWTTALDKDKPKFGFGPFERFFPVSAANFLERESLPGNLYHDYNVGGYIAYRLYPKYGVFQDGRLPAYPPEFIKSLHEGHSGTNFNDLFDRANINVALVNMVEFSFYFRDRTKWALIFWDEDYAILARRSTLSSQTLDRLEYREFLPFPSSDNQLTRQNARRLEYEIQRNLNERAEPAWKPLADLAATKAVLGDRQAALEIITRAQELMPEDPSAWQTLSVCWKILGHPDRARQAAERAKALGGL